MEYIVAKTDEVNPGINSPEWDKAQWGYIDKECNDEGLFPSPKTTFKLLRDPEGLNVLMHTEEKIFARKLKSKTVRFVRTAVWSFSSSQLHGMQDI